MNEHKVEVEDQYIKIKNISDKNIGDPLVRTTSCDHDCNHEDSPSRCYKNTIYSRRKYKQKLYKGLKSRVLFAHNKYILALTPLLFIISYLDFIDNRFKKNKYYFVYNSKKYVEPDYFDQKNEIVLMEIDEKELSTYNTGITFTSMYHGKLKRSYIFDKNLKIKSTLSKI